ncbi:MAG: hypothetical protein ACLPY1_03530 [Terracidiphilus sp.]
MLARSRLSGLALALILGQSVALSAGLVPALPPAISPNAAFAPTETACRFTSGPLAGTIGDYNAPHDLKIGAPCDDGKGSQGIVVLRKGAGGKENRNANKTIPKPAPSPRPDQGASSTQEQPAYEVYVPKPAAAPSDGHAAAPAPVQAPSPTPAAVASQPAVQPPVGAAAQAGGSDYANLTDSQLQQELDDIVNRAKKGAIRDNVPPSMTVGQSVTVMVEIDGANSHAQPADGFHPAGDGSLKVSPLMEVDLDQRENPDSFKIEPDQVQTGQQVVPDDGKVDWVWTVTPLKSGSQMKLDIDAFLVLNAKLPSGQTSNHKVSSKTVIVPVQSQSIAQSVLSFLTNNWATLLGFVLPSGFGVAVLTWFLSRKKAKADSA